MKKHKISILGSGEKYLAYQYEKNTCCWRWGRFYWSKHYRVSCQKSDCYVVSADIRKGTNWDIFNEQHPKQFCSIIDDFTDPKVFNALDNDFDEAYMLAAIVGVNRTFQRSVQVNKNQYKTGIKCFWIGLRQIIR